MSKVKNTKFYTVRTGRKTDIFNTWSECEKQVKGYSGASYASFTSREEADKLAKYALYNAPIETIASSISKNTEVKKSKSSGKLNIYINYKNRDTKIDDVIKK